MDAKEIVKKALHLEDRINQIGKGYHHTTPLSAANFYNEKLNFSLFDWGLIAAFTESPMLLIGDTDRGKTDFAKIIMTSLFGQEERGWHKTDIDIDFGGLSYTDTDFDAIKSGKTSDELFKAKEFLTFPGLIWDEPNRAPAKILNKLLHILEKDITLENGTKLKSGFAYKDSKGQDKTYQFHMLAMNEGEDFHGTSEVDRALKRRQTIEIPLDNYPTTMFDKMLMARRDNITLDIKDGNGSIDDILKISEFVKNIPVSKEAEHLRLYLQSMNYCENSLTKSKRGIIFSEQLCDEKLSTSVSNATQSTDTKCHYLAAYPNKMCPNVYEITDGVSIKLTNVAKSHALIRAIKTLHVVSQNMTSQNDGEGFIKKFWNQKSKNIFEDNMKEYLKKHNPEYEKSELERSFSKAYLENICVEPQDIRAVMPFVAHSKIQLNKHWVTKNYQGSKLLALQKIISTAYENVKSFQNENKGIFQKIIESKELTKVETETLSQIYASDPWLKKSVEGYLSERKSEDSNTTNQRLLDLIA